MKLDKHLNYHEKEYLFLYRYTGMDLEGYNHDKDNSFLWCDDFTEFEMWLTEKGKIFRGLSTNYPLQTTEYVALVFEEEDTGNIYWTHLNYRTLVSWIKRYYDDYDEAIKFLTNELKCPEDCLRILK